MLYIHNYGIFSQLIYKAVRASSLKQLAFRVFNLGKAQGRWTSARERCVVPEEVHCGWNNDSSSKFRHVHRMDTKVRKDPPKKQPDVLLALTTFN